ncbi:hypothetical protein GCM10010341_31950 [Streptomyces noursei]|nr:hypothetical protein GCM10010341_31950 [Streptomyces noursei]
MGEITETHRRAVLRVIWDRNSDPIKRNYGWSDADLDRIVQAVRDADKEMQ